MGCADGVRKEDFGLVRFGLRLQRQTGGTLLLDGLQQLDGGIRVSQHLFHRVRRGVHPVASDGGEYFGGHPLAEWLGLWLVRTKDDVIQAGFVDDGHFLLSAKGVDLTDPLFVLVKSCNNITAVSNVQNIANIFQDEPRLAVILNGANFNAVVVENLNVAHVASLSRY